MLVHFYDTEFTLMEIVYFLLHLLKDPLTTLQDFLAHYEMLTYAILVAIIFVETGLIVMPLLPGDSLLFAVGLLASSTGKLDIQIIIPLLIGAALLGDNVNHYVGKHFSRFVKSREKILFFKREYITQTEEFYEKHGGKAVIMARFVPIIRTIAPFVAGAGSMKYSRYITFCIIGATLWVTSITLAGYFLGSNEWVKHNFEKIVLGIVFVSFMPMVWQFARMKLLKQPQSI
ncbi:MAG: VTT domain-containing protein [Methylobacter sp.]